MARWFGDRWFSRPAATGDDRLDAYKAGRADERARVRETDRDAVAVHDDRAVARDHRAIADEAYERGRREERLRHRGSPLLVFVTLVLVVVALIVLILAVRAGSFEGAGRQIDAVLQRPVQNAADRAGNALQNAGQSLKDKAGSGPS